MEKFSDCWTYPKQKIDELLKKVVPIIRKINGKELVGDVTLTANDVDAVSKTNGGTFYGNVTVDTETGTTSEVGQSAIVVGNFFPAGTDKNSAGRVDIYGRTQYAAHLFNAVGFPTAERWIALPDADGMIALIERTIQKATPLLSSTDDLNNLTNGTDNGFYGIGANVINAPTSWATLLVVASSAGVAQTLFKGSEIYSRYFSGNPGAWSKWFKFTGTEVN